MEVILLFVVASLLVTCIVVYFLKSWGPPVPIPTISNEQWVDLLHNTSMLHAISFETNPRRAYQPLFTVRAFGPFNIAASAVSESKFMSELHYSQEESSLAIFGFANAAAALLEFGASIGGRFSYSNRQQNEEVWVTCEYLIPKFNLHLDHNCNPWMKVNKQFLGEAKALANKGKEATHEEIHRFLADWGEYFPTELIIGAELYSETHKKCDTQATEYGFTYEAEIAFKIDVAKVGLGLGFGAAKGNKKNKMSESLMISCKGGANEQLGRPGVWLESLADPTAWVPIKLDNFLKVLDLLPQSDAKKLEKRIKDYKKKELERPKLILNKFEINLKLSSKDELYLATPKEDYLAKLDSHPCTHIIQLVDAEALTKPISNGDTVRLYCTTTSKGHMHLYSDMLGYAYYEQISDASRQKWKVKIVGKDANKYLCSGDTVQLENMNWEDSMLYMYMSKKRACVGVDEKKPNNEWQVFIS